MPKENTEKAKDKKYDNLSEMHLDALQEIGNIGAGHAAVALTHFLNRSTYMSIPNVEVDKVDNLIDIVKMPKEGKVAIVSLETIQDLEYTLIVFFDEKSIQRIIDLMITELGSDPEEIMELSPLFMSLIKEVGSILLLKYVEALNSFLNVESYPSPPVLRIGSLPSITENELKDLKNKNSQVLLIECDVFTSEKKIQVDMAIIPHEKTFDQFMNALFSEDGE
ncbi:MAG: chemotaxis protein CheC [Candidatus Heimdallarchaeaceae archaeon]